MARPVTRRPGARPAEGRARADDRSWRTRRAGVVLVAASGLALIVAGWIGVSGGFGAPVPSRPSAIAALGSAAPSVGGSGTANASASVLPSAGSSPSPSSSPVLPGAIQNRLALEARLQGVLDRLRVKLGIPGVSATILFPDGSAWTGVSGLANVGRGIPVTPETAFAIASMSKTFTSAEVLSLIDEGRLRLTDSAVALLPAGLPIRLDPKITVAMLLDHTSGLADYFLNPKIDAVLQRSPTRAWTAGDALRYVGKPRSKPGVAWHYANTNYLLLGLIAERVTGRPLAAEIRDRFLDPLGLSRTWYQAVETSGATIAHAYRFTGTKVTAKPIDLADGSGVMPFRSVVTAAGGAGSIAATTEDLARWARALYGGDVLGPVGTGLLLSDFTKTVGYVRGVAYGYGVQALSIDGHASLGHSGRLLGSRGVVRHFPIEGYTIAVLTNQSRADPAGIVRALLAIVEPPPKPPVASPSPSASGIGSAPTASPPGSSALPSESAGD
jgi:D-alanyl-D-alanine carboxypeptidase